jgi:Fis family transcriptional regulator
MVLAEVERPLLACVLEKVGGNQSRAAQVLGISRSTLRKKLAHYHIA